MCGCITCTLLGVWKRTGSPRHSCVLWGVGGGGGQRGALPCVPKRVLFLTPTRSTPGRRLPPRSPHLLPIGPAPVCQAVDAGNWPRHLALPRPRAFIYAAATARRPLACPFAAQARAPNPSIAPSRPRSLPAQAVRTYPPPWISPAAAVSLSPSPPLAWTPTLCT